MIRPDSIRPAAERPSTLDGDLVRSDAIDLGAERHEKVTEILHVRFAGGVPKDRDAGRGDGGRDGVLGCRDTRLIEKHVRTA